MAVEWSLPPNWSPIPGKEACNSSRIRNMAIWRGLTISFSAGSAGKLLGVYIVKISYSLNNLFGVNPLFPAGMNNVRENLFDIRQGGLNLLQFARNHDSTQGALEFPNIILDIGGNII